MPPPDTTTTPAGIPGLELTGPWPVGRYAVKLREWLRGRARVQLFGEVWNWRGARTRGFFELRDAEGAGPCGLWVRDFEKLDPAPRAGVDGAPGRLARGPGHSPPARPACPGV